MSFEDETPTLNFDADVDVRPLAERLRPTLIHEYVGQSHLLGEGRPLAGLIERGTIASMILWGPPGTGKTTLAQLLAHNADVRFIALSAVLAGVKDVREAVERAKMEKSSGRKTVLFVDEVHRFNKAQQDAFLPHVENGTVTFIGATTENPSFEVNSALLSRARVYVLKALTKEDLAQVLARAGYALSLQISEQAREVLIEIADGDARRMLNVIEMAAQLAEGSLELEHVESAFGERLRRFDKGGDHFYDQISALHKSVRGSDPDAALYWFCRMLDGGADPRYLGRRIIRIASEDVGNADPRALTLTISALESYERLGSPEGELALAQAVLYLASVPKSDAAYKAFGSAMGLVRETESFEVPMHIRNAPTSLMKSLGAGDGYRHAHNEITEEGAYAVGENYFPEDLGEQSFYQPTDQGLGAKIKARLERLRQLSGSDT